MGLEGVEERGDALDQGIIDDALILESLDVILALLALSVDLILLGSDERSLVDVWVYLDVGVIAEL